MKQANSSRSNREFPSRGELTRSIANQPRQSEEDELSFGLGDWDSDDDDTGKKRYMYTYVVNLSVVAKFRFIWVIHELEVILR